MRHQLNELLERIQGLQEEVEEEYRQRREEFDRRRADLAERIPAHPAPLQGRPAALPGPQPPAGGTYRAGNLPRLDTVPADGPVRQPVPGGVLPDLSDSEGASGRITSSSTAKTCPT
jgi:hypothetical protein